MHILQLLDAIIARLPAAIGNHFVPFSQILRASFSQNNDQSAAQAMALTAFTVRVISAAIAFASHILFARLIGQFEYGIYALVWVMVIIFGNLSCLGFHSTLIRFLPIYANNNSHEHFRGLNYASRLTALIAATIFAVLGLTVIALYGDLIESYYLVPVCLGLFTLPMIALGDTLDGTARANGWPMAAMQYTYLIRPVLVILMMLLALLLGFETSATTAMLAALLATIITSLWQLLATKSRLKNRIPSGKAQFEYRKWLRFALPMLVIDGIGFLMTNSDVVIVGLYMPPDQVAVYFAAAKTIVLMQFVFFAVKAAAGPRFANLMAKGNSSDLREVACQIARWSFWPSLAMGLLLLLAGPWLLALFGQGFASGYPLIGILFLGFLTKSAIGPAETLLNMAGKQFLCVWLYAITFLTNVTLNIILIPVYGLKGAAIATSLAMALETLLLLSATRHQLGIWLTPMPVRASASVSSGARNGE